MRTIILVLALFPIVADGREPGFRGVLLPVTVNVDGVGGRFVTQLQGFAPADCIYFPTGGSGSNVGVIGPAISQRFFFLPRPASPPTGAEPRFLFITESCFQQVSLSLTIFSSVQPTRVPAQRTRVPIIRNDQFLTGPTQILDVPADWSWPPFGNCDFECTQSPIYRHTLRVIADNEFYGTEVRVRVWKDSGAGSFPTSVTVQDYTMRLDRRDGSDPSYPTYGELNLPNGCYQARGACSPSTGVRVELIPQAGVRYWGYVSSTENETQRVLISTPSNQSVH